MTDKDRNEFVRWWMIALPLLALTLITLGILNMCGVMAGTVVERKVLENSYQNSEARKTEIMTLEAQLEEIDTQLADPATGESTKRNLQGQRRAIQVRLKVAKQKSNDIILH